MTNKPGQIVAVSPCYYDLTYRFVSQLKDSGLEKISKSTNIPLDKLKNFARSNKKNRYVSFDGSYIPALYSHLFEDMTPLQAISSMKRAGW